MSEEYNNQNITEPETAVLSTGDAGAAGNEALDEKARKRAEKQAKREAKKATKKAAKEELSREEAENEKKLDKEEELKRLRFRKKLIRRIAIIFVIILLLLTFFSNTIMNYSLPEVSTVTVSRGNVAQKIRCEGQVEVSKDIEVTISGERKVKEVMFEDGDEVKEGDVIMTFEADEDSDLKKAEDELETLENDYQKVLLDRSDNDSSEEQNKLNKAKEELATAQAALDQAKVDEASLAAARAAQDEAQYNYDAKNVEVSGLQTEVDAYTNIPDYSGDVDVDALIAKLSTAKEELTQLEADLTAKKDAVTELETKTTVATAQQTYDEKSEAVDTAQKDLDKKIKDNGKTAQKNAIDDAESLKEIEEKKAEIEKLKKTSDYKDIKAQGSGIISGITAKAGDKIEANATIASIQLADGGYEMSCSIDKNDAMKLKVGNEATAENVYEDDVTSTVRSIKADPSDPNRKSIVKFTVKGSVQTGQTLQLAVGDKSQRYDAVVPNSAVKEGGDGKFVYVVTVKATPLGNRYIAKKTKVEVLASDSSSSALSGEVSEYDNVITNASKPIDNGQQVRLSDK